MEVLPRAVRAIQTPDGRIPFWEWLGGLHDPKARDAIRVRIRRLSLGLMGDCRPVGEGVLEARVHVGPGYRLYVGLWGPRLILLLCGGDKRDQDQDIERAKRLWRDFRGIP